MNIDPYLVMLKDEQILHMKRRYRWHKEERGGTEQNKGKHNKQMHKREKK